MSRTAQLRPLRTGLMLAGFYVALLMPALAQNLPSKLPSAPPPAALPTPAPSPVPLPQSPATRAAIAKPPVPSFWDPRRRPERPDMSRVNLIRFMTEVDYPPFDYAGQDGNPTGFNVDLARLICDELKVPCTMQMRRFDTLIDALNENKGDAAIASMAVTGQTRAQVDFSDPYYRPIGRFAARREAGAVFPEPLDGKKIAVVSGTAHEANMRARCSPKPTFVAIRAQTLRATRSDAARSICCSATDLAGVLAQRHRFEQLLRVRGRALCGKPRFRRRRRDRGQTRQ